MNLVIGTSPSLENQIINGVNQITGVRIIDVGQGDCAGLMDEYGEVFCYVDYGGRIGHPDPLSKPNDTKARMPDDFRHRKATIVLTHWDNDHFWTAHKRNPDAQRCPWLVPQQHVSAQAARFAAKLVHARLAPEPGTHNPYASMKTNGGDELSIQKTARFDPTATTENRNHTGLTVVATHQTDFGSQHMVFVGDCAYHKAVHSWPSPEIRYVSAFHHGSKSNWVHRTGDGLNASGSSNTVVGFSYSASNNYGHPYEQNYNAIATLDMSLAIHTPDLRQAGLKFRDVSWV